MGIDISFSREAAVNAGLEVESIPNGTPEEIDDAEWAVMKGQMDPGHLAWLMETEPHVRAPGTGKYFHDGGNSDTVIVRKDCSDSDKGLIQFLESHKISWAEA